MTNESSRPNPLLDDDRMDQLLAAFYDSEVPEKLDRLPSSWPELHSATVEARPPVTLAAGSTDADVPHVPTARRGIAVAAATLAACLMLMVFSSMSGQVEDSGTAKAPAPTETNSHPLLPADSATFPVSGGEANGAVDENNTTLEEIDSIDLSPRLTSTGNSESVPLSVVAALRQKVAADAAAPLTLTRPASGEGQRL